MCRFRNRSILEPTYFSIDDGGKMFLQTFGIHPKDYRMPQYRRPLSTLQTFQTKTLLLHSTIPLQGIKLCFQQINNNKITQLN